MYSYIIIYVIYKILGNNCKIVIVEEKKASLKRVTNG